MNRWIAILVLIGVTILGCKHETPPPQSKTEVSDTDRLARLKTFLGQFKQAIKTNDKKWIAERIEYPAEIYIAEKKKQVVFRSSEEMASAFDVVFNEKIKNIVLSQSENELQLYFNCVIIGSGYMRICEWGNLGRITITQINQ